MTAHIRIASIHDVSAGSGKEFVAGSHIVALFNLDGRFHAIDGICAHAGGPVAKGAVKGCIVTCPWHGWQYDVTTGKHCLNDRISQESFPVTIEGEDVYVDVPE